MDPPAQRADVLAGGEKPEVEDRLLDLLDPLSLPLDPLNGVAQVLGIPHPSEPPGESGSGPRSQPRSHGRSLAQAGMGCEGGGHLGAVRGGTARMLLSGAGHSAAVPASTVGSKPSISSSLASTVSAIHCSPSASRQLDGISIFSQARRDSYSEPPLRAAYS